MLSRAVDSSRFVSVQTELKRLQRLCCSFAIRPRDLMLSRPTDMAGLQMADIDWI